MLNYMPTEDDRRARRARADHAAAAVEALHAAIQNLNRASYHLAATELTTPAVSQVVTATDTAVKAHAIVRLLLDRMPLP